MLASDVILAQTVVGTSVAIAIGCLTVGELVAKNCLEDTFVRSKSEYCHKKCKRITKWLQRMWILRNESNER